MLKMKLIFSLFWDLTRWVAPGIAGVLLATGAAQASVVTVVSSGGFAGAFRALAPQFERATGNTVVTKWGPSMGNPRMLFLPGSSAESQSTW